MKFKIFFTSLIHMANVNFNSLCYEQIKYDYWYSLFSEFKLIIGKKTYFNTTKIDKKWC